MLRNAILAAAAVAVVSTVSVSSIANAGMFMRPSPFPGSRRDPFVLHRLDILRHNRTKAECKIITGAAC
jgi:hypothetical protein